MQGLIRAHGRCNLLVIIANKAVLCWADKQSSLSCGCLVWIIAAIFRTWSRKMGKPLTPLCCSGEVWKSQLIQMFFFMWDLSVRLVFNWKIYAFCTQWIKVNMLGNEFQDCFLPSISASYVMIWVEKDLTAIFPYNTQSSLLAEKSLGKMSEMNSRLSIKWNCNKAWTKYCENTSEMLHPTAAVIPLNTARCCQRLNVLSCLSKCARERVSEVLKFFYVFKCTLSTPLSWITCYFWVIYARVSQQRRPLWAVCASYEFLFSSHFISVACLNSLALEDSTRRLFLFLAAC